MLYSIIVQPYMNMGDELIVTTENEQVKAARLFLKERHEWQLVSLRLSFAGASENDSEHINALKEIKRRDMALKIRFSKPTHWPIKYWSIVS